MDSAYANIAFFYVYTHASYIDVQRIRYAGDCLAAVASRKKKLHFLAHISICMPVNLFENDLSLLLMGATFHYSSVQLFVALSFLQS